MSMSLIEETQAREKSGGQGEHFHLLKLIVLAIAIIASLICAGTLIGCTGGPVAATVNGDPIYESEVTEYVGGLRERLGLVGDEEWAQWMSSSGKDAASVRSDAISYLAREKAIEQDAEEKGASVADADVDAKYAEVMEYYGCADDGAFAEVLANMNYTPRTYRDFLRQSMLQERIAESLGEDAPSDWEGYVSGLVGGAQIEIVEMPQGLPYDVANGGGNGDASQ